MTEPLLQARGIAKSLRPRGGAPGCRFRRPSGRSHRPDRRQRRRQEHAGETPSGVLQPDAGRYPARGREVRLASPRDAQDARDRDGLSGFGSLPDARPRPPTCSMAGRSCALACWAGSAFSTSGRCACARPRRSSAPRRGAPEVDAPVGELSVGSDRACDLPGGDLGAPCRVHGRADGGARRGADAPRARSDPAHARQGTAVVLISHNMRT